jgi:hypothetical protein
MALNTSQAEDTAPLPLVAVPPTNAASKGRPYTDGKFLRAGGERLLVKGVTYGTFAPTADGHQYPAPARVAEDFALMAAHGVNTVRTYTLPPQFLLDEAARHGLYVMAGVPWSQHVAFLEDRKSRQEIQRGIVADVRSLGHHPALLLVAGMRFQPRSSDGTDGTGSNTFSKMSSSRQSRWPQRPCSPT